MIVKIQYVNICGGAAKAVPRETGIALSTYIRKVD